MGEPPARGPRLRARQVWQVLAALPFLPLAVLRRRWAHRWGATDPEADGPMAGDDALSRAHFRATRAITVAAPSAAVWPWIVQIGRGRAGFYAADLVDNGGRPSAERVLPAWQDPGAGDLAAPLVPRPGERTSYRVARVDPPHVLVWTNPDSCWSWRLTPLDGDRTRLVTRLSQRYRRRPSAVLVALALEVGDLAMMRQMLRGIARRAEHPAGPASGSRVGDSNS